MFTKIKFFFLHVNTYIIGNTIINELTFLVAINDH